MCAYVRARGNRLNEGKNFCKLIWSPNAKMNSLLNSDLHYNGLMTYWGLFGFFSKFHQVGLDETINFTIHHSVHV